MATITAAAGGGNWTAGGTWTGGVAPTAADDALLIATSGPVTINTGAVARSLNCTGYSGTLTHTAGVALTLGDPTAGLSSVALTLVSGMTYTLGDPATSAISFVSTSATQQTITTGGKSLGNWTVNGAGSSYILGDANTIGATATFTLTAGTFNAGNFACSWGLLLLSGATAKTLTLGSSAIAITGNAGTTVNFSGSNATATANTATMTCSGSSSGIAGSLNWNGMSVVFATTCIDARLFNSPTFANVTYVSSAVKSNFVTIAGAFTITGTFTLTGNSTVNRIIVRTDVAGTARTVTVGTGFSFSNVDFQDITAAGAAGTWTGTSMGNALGNSGITFDTPATQTHTASAGGNWSDVTKWTSRVPLPQDNVIVDVNTTGTLTADMPRLGADVTFTGFAGTAAFSSTPNTLYGSLTLASGMTVSGTQALTLSARSAKTITSSGKAITQNITVNAPGGTYTLQDATQIGAGASGFITFSGGTLNTNGQAVTANWTINTSAGSVLTITNSVLTCATGSGSPWNFQSPASTTLNAAGSTIIYSAVTVSPLTFVGGGKTYGTLTYTPTGSTGSLTITGANTFGTLNFSDASNARSLLFTAGTTTTITTAFNVFGTAGKLMTVDSATAATHTLSKSNGPASASDYLSIAHSIATGGSNWYSGANSTDAGSNTGWIFTALPPAAFTGTGTLGATGVPSFSGTAALSGTGTLGATGVPSFQSTGALSGTGTLSATGIPVLLGAAAFTGSGTLAVVGQPRVNASATFTGTGTLSGLGAPRLTAAAALTASGTLTATGVVVRDVNVTIGGVYGHVGITVNPVRS